MEDNQGQADPNSPSNNHQRGTTERSEPVRSRWTPKPEQILILESIFNSGMVNPPKDETVRIRKLLETFGSVGDANVFYWFQNRRSRSRRRQRQMQASLQGGGGDQRNSSSSSSSNNNNNNNFIVSTQAQDSSSGGGAIHQYAESGIYSTNYMSMGFSISASTFVANSSPSSYLFGSSSSCGVVGDNGMESLFPMSNQMGLHEIDQYGPRISHPVYCSSSSSSSETSDLHYQTGGFVTVFINGVPTEVPRRPIDTRAMFGEDVILVHSTGLPIPTNEFGFLMQSLQHGESYFLVSRPA